MPPVRVTLYDRDGKSVTYSGERVEVVTDPPAQAPAQPPAAPVAPPAPDPVPTPAPAPATPPAPADAVAWAAIGREWDTIIVPPDTRVRYGVDRVFVERAASGTFRATNEFFGRDPVPGVRKTVWAPAGTASRPAETAAAAPPPAPAPPPVAPAPAPAPAAAAPAPAPSKAAAPAPVAAAPAPAAPPAVKGASVVPATLDLLDYTDPARPVSAGVLVLDAVRPALRFTDPETAAAVGEVGIRQTGKPLSWAGFEWGATAFDCPPATNGDDPTAPWYQVLVACKPSGRWTTYPAADTFNQDTDATFPPPFKMLLRAADGALLHTFEMYQDGLPINSPALRVLGWDDKQPLRNHFNCANMLAWQSATPRLLPSARKLLPGVTADTVRPSVGKLKYSCNGAIPGWGLGSDGKQQNNGVNHWYAMPAWPDVARGAYNYHPTEPRKDAYLFDLGINYGQNAGITGWRYEPGSQSGHDWVCGPGGVRFDRAVVPAPLMLYVTNPEFKRLKDGADIRKMVSEWGLAYFNHSCMFTRDVATLGTIPVSEVMDGWSYGRHYYGDRFDYVAGGKARHVDAVALGNGGYDPDEASRLRFYQFRGANGERRRVWNGYEADNHHGHQSAALWTLLLGSPMHIVAAKHFLINNHLAQLGSRRYYGEDVTSRTAAYKFMHLLFGWKIATDHPLGVSRAQIESMLLADLETYADTTVPYNTDGKRVNLETIGRQRFGMPIEQRDGSNNDHAYVIGAPSLGYYWSLNFALMKTTGLWSAIRARSAKAASALDWIMQMLDRFSLDYIVHTGGRFEGGWLPVSAWVPKSQPLTYADIAADYAEATAKASYQKGDWIRDKDGKFVERYSGQHMRAQWAFMRRDYYPEVPHPLLEQACAKYQKFYDEWEAGRVKVHTDPRTQGSEDWAYRLPGYGRLLAPVA